MMDDLKEAEKRKEKEERSRGKKNTYKRRYMKWNYRFNRA